MCIGDAINFDALVGFTFLVTIVLIAVVMCCTVNLVTFISFIVTKFFGFWTMVVGSAFDFDAFVTGVGTVRVLLGFTSA